ncbi:hypothetical protein Nmel_012786 [Mimus melanotis]
MVATHKELFVTAWTSPTVPGPFMSSAMGIKVTQQPLGSVLGPAADPDLQRMLTVPGWSLSLKPGRARKLQGVNKPIDA